MRLFKEQIDDPTATTSFNPFGGVAGVDIDVGDYRCTLDDVVLW